MKKTCVILIIIISIFLGCGKDKIKPSADSLTAQEALRITNVIKTAYEGKNQDTLKDNLSPKLAENMIEGLSFEKAELSFTPRIIKITDSTVAVNLNWRGTWVVRGKTFKNIGSGILVFQNRSMKLIQIDGDNPFLIPLTRD